MESGKIDFRKLAEEDLDLLYKWLNNGFARTWYSKKDISFDEVIKKYLPRINGEELINCYVIMHNEIPIGHIQVYKIKDYPDYSKYVDAAEEAAGIDLFIGEDEYIHKGLGKEIIKEFLKNNIFKDNLFESCFIDPDIDNLSAIKAYEKVGFRYIKTIADEKVPKYLMRINKNEID